MAQNKFRLVYNSTRHVSLNESSIESSLDEPMKLLNPIYASLLEGTRVSAGQMASNDPQLKAQLIASAIRLSERYNESLFINTTAREALLGRRVVFVEKARKLIETFGITSIKLPEFGNNNLFGFVALINGTEQGPYEIYTGYQASMSSLGELISYKGRRRQTEFQGRCNRMQTSLGELRPMPIKEEQMLELYQPQLCRILRLQPTGLRKLREGSAIGYNLFSGDFSNASQNLDNACYCKNDIVQYTNDNYCSLNGALELAPCSYYSPIVITVSNIEPDSRISQSIGNWDPELINSEIDSLPPIDRGAQFLILKRVGIPIRADLTTTIYLKVTRDPTFK